MGGSGWVDFLGYVLEIGINKSSFGFKKGIFVSGIMLLKGPIFGAYRNSFSGLTYCGCFLTLRVSFFILLLLTFWAFFDTVQLNSARIC
jgi:hypothetical protein